MAFCRFDGEINTEGYRDTEGKGHCISPLLYQTGWLSVEVSSDNGTTFNRKGAWLSGRTPSSQTSQPHSTKVFFSFCLKVTCHILLAVHTGKLDAKFKATLVNSTKWQYYGTPGVSGSLQMEWRPELVRAERVNLELWGYRETGKSAFQAQVTDLEIERRKFQFLPFSG